MEQNPPEPVPARPAPRHGRLFLAGALLFFLGPVLYVIQIQLCDLRVPWHIPVLASFGCVLMAISVGRGRGIWQGAGLILFTLLVGLEWYVLVVETRSPVYSGPAQPGSRVPVFATTLADGTAFTDKDLARGGRTVLVFFRGRW